MAFNLVLVGKPNVGKSTLFNLLAKKKLAIVENIRGVTVDVKEANASLFDISFKVIDTGGFNLNTKDNNSLLNVKIWDQAIKAISKADLIAFLVDAKDGITSEDKELSLKLRKMNNKPSSIILIINKIDTKNSEENIQSALELGFKNTVQLSATHSYGLTELYETILPFFNKYSINNKNKTQDVPPYLTIGVVGKPNVGKSTLINSLFKEERLITSNIPGTTRDAISLYIEHKKKKLRIIDTAGLRKQSKIENNTLEKISNSDTIRTIIFSQVVILMISATEGLTKQDLIIASNIINEGRAIMIVINKIDLIKNKQKQFINNIRVTLDTTFGDIKKINIIGISAINNYNIDRIFNTALKIYTLWNTKIKTSFLNRWLSEELSYNPPPLNKGRIVKIKLITQIKSRPPTFNLWVNTKDGIPNTYLKFLQNKIYEKFDLYGIPIRLNIKLPNNPYSRNK